MTEQRLAQSSLRMFSYDIDNIVSSLYKTNSRRLAELIKTI